jgi:hypothetical protein
MEIYQGSYAQKLARLTRQEREQIMLKILIDNRLKFEGKVNNHPSRLKQTAQVLAQTLALSPNPVINKIAVDWCCMGVAERYVLIAQLALMNIESYEAEDR